MELFDALMTRRSIRKYTTDAVDDDKIEKILEAGRWAPSWANTQCWRFIVVKDPAVKEKIADCMITTKRPDGSVGGNPAANAVNTVPVVIVVCAETGKSGCKPGPQPDGLPVTDKGDWFMFDTALAVENMALAAHALGLGTVIVGLFDAPKAEKALEIPEGYRIVTFFPLGVPAQEGKAPPRKELSEIAFKDTWGKNL